MAVYALQDQGRDDRARELGNPVGQDPALREHAARGERERDRWVECSPDSGPQA